MMAVRVKGVLQVTHSDYTSGVVAALDGALPLLVTGSVCGHGDPAGPASPGWLSREVPCCPSRGCGGSAAPCVST